MMDESIGIWELWGALAEVSWLFLLVTAAKEGRMHGGGGDKICELLQSRSMDH